MSAIRPLDAQIAYPLRPQNFSTSAAGPEWDFTSSTGNPTDFVIGKVVGEIPDPTGDPSFNADWLELDAVAGLLATQIFRIDTVGGQPPASVCLSIARL
jgi:hypothetical protein